MKMTEIKAIATERGIKCGRLNKTDLVRNIQQQEGNTTCFNTGRQSTCGQDQCLWRADCH